MHYVRKSRLLSLILIVFALLANDLTALRAQTPANPKPPGLPKNSTIVTDPDTSQEAFVIERYKTLYRFEKDGTGVREMSTSVKIQSDAGIQQFGQLVFPYSSANEKIEFKVIRVRKPEIGRASCRERV